jgi:very-short-patch-repair endonuclease
LILERGKKTRGYIQSNLKHAKSMRKEMTTEELKLWQKIKNNQLGYKLRRQQPIKNFIVDFVCYEKRLIIELRW